MMRSLYSGVSGLKTHQSKMDVIGNNIANVNTVAFKSSSVTFSDLMYQTTASATGPNARTGGKNAKQVGLGVTSGATSVNITSQGAAQSTGGAFDIRLSDSSSTTSFFIVNNGTQNVFTRAGSFYVDGAGNLCMSSTGYQVMGWAVDKTTGELKQDTVTQLQVMNEGNMTSPPEATTYGTCGGVLDSNDKNVTGKDGYTMSLNFYDALGYPYNAKFSVKATGEKGKFTVELSDILDSKGESILGEVTDKSAIFGKNYDGTTPETTKSYTCKLKTGCSAMEKTVSGTLSDGTSASTTHLLYDGNDYYGYDGTNFYNVKAITTTDATGAPQTEYRIDGKADAGVTLSTFFNTPIGDDVTLTLEGTDADGYTCKAVKTGVFYELVCNSSTGLFSSIADGTAPVDLKLSEALGGNFKDISVDFSTCKTYNNNGTSTLGMTKGKGDSNATGAGKKLGNLIGLSVGSDGLITGTYDNGNKETLGKIVVTQFANASGLEKIGDNCYATTLNSGEFDGVGVDITASGGTMASGQLEMSNVDLSTEFTEMITTQRGFQANSRIITTSDSLLEELVNLKR